MIDTKGSMFQPENRGDLLELFERLALADPVEGPLYRALATDEDRAQWLTEFGNDKPRVAQAQVRLKEPRT